MLTQEEITELDRILTESPQMDQMDALIQAKDNLKNILTGIKPED